jgi:hypothetical protein
MTTFWRRMLFFSSFATFSRSDRSKLNRRGFVRGCDCSSMPCSWSPLSSWSASSPSLPVRLSSALRTVALIEAAKGALALLVGFGLLSLIHHDVPIMMAEPG